MSNTVKMPAGRRLVCIIFPLVFTLLSAICMILVGQGGSSASNATATKFYFMQIDVANFVSVGSQLDTSVLSIGALPTAIPTAIPSNLGQLPTSLPTGLPIPTGLGIPTAVLKGKVAVYTAAGETFTVTPRARVARREAQMNTGSIPTVLPTALPTGVAIPTGAIGSALRDPAGFAENFILSGLFTGSNLTTFDFYDISLWNYCAGHKSANGSDATYQVEFCNPTTRSFAFDPRTAWNIAESSSIISDAFRTSLNAYGTAARWLWVSYLLSWIATAIVLILMPLAALSRVGSIFASVAASLATFFALIAAITTWALYGIVIAAFNTAFNVYQISASIGRLSLIFSWLGVLFSLLASLTWLFSACCCSGHRSRRHDRARSAEFSHPVGPYPPLAHDDHHSGPEMGYTGMRTEKKGYEPVVQEHHHADSGYSTPQNGAGRSPVLTQETGTAYEPYRHL